ncbi:hypothetical protein [Carboxylicivirga caseinilyticus]|uniref:hypothetical protein n=1 Tax=Carboxylicivirga caseinilyticus TaxID=3417572 RepID=UPI003D32AFF2|nr:hypothetical protein [Marinilabiliaceae bacterium A049]
MNIQFEYLFRDAGNYKTFGEVVFTNQHNLAIAFVITTIEKGLIEGRWFDPDRWQIPRFGFHKVNAFGLDGFLWYEFDAILTTKVKPNQTKDVAEWLSIISSLPQPRF